MKNKIVFFDLETTGTDVTKDRICQIALVLTDENLNVLSEKKTLVNPEMPIPIESSNVHQIYDQDVITAPKFKDIAQAIFDIVDRTDLAGHNIVKFDIPILTRQLSECGFIFNPYKEGKNIYDTLQNEIVLHPRTLEGCFKFYYPERSTEEIDFHDALADVKVCIDVFRKQDELLTEKELNVEEVSLGGVRPAESTMSFVWKDGEVIFNFGKHKGKPAKSEKTYLQWYAKQELNLDTKMLVNMLLK